ncbi:MAG: anti sigma factor C-terminal domain-containing protein [Oscillospiraceae bacterium]|nr:anti sigma factor C-terminal domain-containing protein [Oscillospiraceae bacterium]
MKFEELLKRYQDGTASAEEIAAVEEELAKARLIEEFLAAQDALPLPKVSDEAKTQMKSVQRTIKRRTRGVALAVVSAVLALLLLLQFVLLPLANRRVFDDSDYNPDPRYLSEYEMSMDILTQIFLPFYRYHGSDKSTTGFGQWTVYNAFWGLNGEYATPEFTVTAGRLDTASEEFFWMFPPVNTVDITDRYQQEGYNSGDEALARLDDSIEVAASVSFNRVLTLEEVLALREAYKGEVEVYSAVLDWRWNRPIQLSLEPNAIGWGEAVNEGYPLMWSWNQKDFTTEDWHQHFESQLRYLADHGEALWRKFDEYSSPEKMLAKLAESGLTFKGLWVVGTGEAILSLYDSGVVGDVWGQSAYINLY